MRDATHAADSPFTSLMRASAFVVLAVLAVAAVRRTAGHGPSTTTATAQRSVATTADAAVERERAQALRGPVVEPATAGDIDASARPLPAPFVGVPADAHVVVTVLGDDARAVAGAQVRLVRGGTTSLVADRRASLLSTADTPAPAAVVVTDDAGRAGVSGALAGRWLAVVDAPGWGRGWLELAWTPEDPPTEATFSLRREAVLDVSVVDAEGAALDAADVVVTTSDVDPRVVTSVRRWRALGDASGRVRVGGLVPGRYCVYVESPTETFHFAASVRVPEVTEVRAVVPAGGRLRGRVVDRAGHGIVGARVSFWTQEWEQAMRPAAVAVSGPGGVYDARTCAAPLALSRLDVQAQGFATLRAPILGTRVEPGRATSVRDAVVAPEARIEGVVLDGAEPVAGARVEAQADGPYPRWGLAVERTTTAADGAFVVAGLPAGPVLVRVVEPGPLGDFVHGAVTSAETQLVLAEGASIVWELAVSRDARASRRVVLAGVVRDAEGAPARHVEVRVEHAAQRRPAPALATTLTCADGSFELRVDAGEDTELRVAALDTEGSIACDMRIDVAGQTECRDIELSLPTVLVVRGRVRADSSVAGTRVRVARYDPARDVWGEVSTSAYAVDDGGAFRIAVAPPGREPGSAPIDDARYVILVDSDAYAPSVSPVFRVAGARGGVDVGDVELSEGASIVGVVVDEDGLPLADATVCVRAWRIRPDPVSPAEVLAIRMPGIDHAMTDATGTFVIPRLAALAYDVDVDADGHVPETVRVDAPADSVRVALARAHAIYGVVLDASGRPLPYARVSTAAGDVDDTTDAAGRFALDPLRAGSYEVRVDPPVDGPDARPCVTPLATGMDVVEIRMRRMATLGGRLVDGRGEPLAGWAAELSPAGSTESRRMLGKETGTAGRFHFDRLPAGPAELTFELEGERISVLGVEIVDDSAFEPPLEVRLGGEESIAGTVRLPAASDRAAVVHVRLRPLDSRVERNLRRASRIVSRSADFVFHHVPPGRYRLEATYGDDATHTASVETDAGDTHVVIDLTR